MDKIDYWNRIYRGLGIGARKILDKAIKEEIERFNMEVVHKDLPGIGRNIFRIKLDKNAFRSNFIVSKFPPAYKAIYKTDTYIKTINLN